VARIFGSTDFQGEHLGPLHWLKEDSAYLELRAVPRGKGQQIVRHKLTSGDVEIVVRAEQLVPEGASERLQVDDFSISPDGCKLLLFANTRRVWRRNSRGDYWIYDCTSKTLRKLGGKFPESSLFYASFDPQGHRVAYVYKNNIFVEDPGSGSIVPLTSDGGTGRINGMFDWVYEEELFLYDGFRWSPDGQSIAYWQIDNSGVPEYPMLDTSAGLYPRVIPVLYPRTGQQNPSARVGVVPVGGGTTRWLELSGDPRQHYIARVQWVPGSSDLIIQRLNRRQDTLEVILADLVKGTMRTILSDRDEAWVDVDDDLEFCEGGRAFTWTTERDSWRRLEVVRTRENGPPRQLITGAFDVISVGAIDKKAGTCYFTASPENPTQSYLYRVPVDGSARATRVTPLDQPGTHVYRFSPGGEWAIHTYSSFGRPPITELVSLPDHRVVRTLEGNAKLRGELDALAGDRGEFFRVDIGDGVVLDGWCLKPPGFDPTRRYPVLVHVYGEPAAQNVVDRWGGELYLWHRMLAQKGYVVLSVDNRGTPAPRGRAWRKCVYRQVGILAPEEQAKALKALEERRPFLDRGRVGIWGWSGGGSMTLDCLFRYPELYQTGMAIAFVADQRFYDTIYQERYMGRPSDNPEGYKQGSPITHAQKLQGNLLLVHGTGDDNVHYQNCEALVDRLIALGKPFSMMAYPNRTHSISEGEGTRRHLFELLTRFLEQNLPPGPRG
jgi:dipeptidyl-peptidase-4